MVALKINHRVTVLWTKTRERPLVRKARVARLAPGGRFKARQGTDATYSWFTPAEEGVLWVRGWDTPAARALAAEIALEGGR